MAASQDPINLLLVSDLDNTMVDHKDPEHTSLKEFGKLWTEKFSKDSLLVFSTGRSPHLYEKLREEQPLLTPNITIMSVGTEIVYGDSLTPDSEWEKILDQGWDRAVVVEEAKKHSDLKFQEESEQRPHKVSFHVNKEQAKAVIEAMESNFRDRGVKAKLIYSGGIDLDVLSSGAGKGAALAYLLEKFKKEGRTPKNTLVCGDSGNDAELFDVPTVKGVMVSNAMEELVRWYEDKHRGAEHIFRATERCAGGIIEAIHHFNF